MTFVKVTAKELHEQCQYGLIKDYPVSIAESRQKFKQLLTSKGTKTKNFRCSAIYNVVCLHNDCAQSSQWENRRNFRNFRGNHWNVKHNKLEQSQCKVVSFFTTEETDGITKLLTEYRLVDDQLNYIRQNAQDSIDMDLNSPVDADSEHSEDDFAAVREQEVSSPLQQRPHIPTTVIEDHSNRRKRNAPPSHDDVD